MIKRNFAKIRKGASNALTYVLLATLGILWVLPIFYLVYTAFRITPSTGIINTLFPTNLKLGIGNFIKLFQDTMFARWLMNTILVAVCSCALTTAFILMVSYALSRLRFRMRKPIMNVLLVLGMFPGFMSMIAVYFILKAMGLTNSLLALILVYSGSAALSYYIACCAKKSHKSCAALLSERLSPSAFCKSGRVKRQFVRACSACTGRFQSMASE